MSVATIPVTNQSPTDWLASLALSLASGPDAPAFDAEAVDPILALERQWFDLEEQQEPLEREFDELKEGLAWRIGGGPQDYGYRTRWKRDPANRRLKWLDNELTRLVDLQCDIRDKMISTDATSLAGFMAKVRIVAHFSHEEADSVAVQPVTVDVLNDIVRLIAQVPV